MSAHGLSEQWLASKQRVGGSQAPSWAFENKSQLLEALGVVLPGFDTDDAASNPLNLILHEYVALWRVVLRCFLELTSRSHDQARAWKEVLWAFVSVPTFRQLRQDTINDSAVSAEQIAKESLHLFTPTRRIYREFKNNYNEAVQASADIKKLHRDTMIWGPDAQQFSPRRWSTVDRAFEDNHILAFGSRPFRYPAGRRKIDGDKLPIGVAFISSLVGFSTSAVEGHWKLESEIPMKEDPLQTDGDAYEDLALERHISE